MIDNKQELYSQRELLNGNLNRMCVTDDMDELEDMLVFAEFRMKQIFFYNKRRIESK